MNLAALSLGALAIAVIVSCVTQLNVGVLSLAMAWIIGVYFAGMPVNEVMAGFPTQIFLTLTGVMLLFSIAQCNGTLDKLAHYAVRLCRGNRGVIPIMFFVLSAALGSMGPGSIATAALIGPMAMATAARAGIPLFLMAIMAGNGANAGSLSPFAPTGIIVNNLMPRIGLGGHEVQSYLYILLAHAIVATGGYIAFGGLRLFAGKWKGEPAEASQAFDRPNWITLVTIAILIISVIFFKVHVGMGAFLASVVLMLLGCGSDREAIKRMPWGVIVMVCGVTVLVTLVEKTHGIDLFVSLVARFSTAGTVTGLVALITGIISVYSSTSAVVLPTFLPMVPGLAERLAGADPMSIAMSMTVGAHLVDVSPLSTTGALCIASAAAGADSRALFNKLLAWGLSMSFVGALLCWAIFR